MKNNPRLRRMLKFKITEISAVRKPAQEGATVGIVKGDTNMVIAKASRTCATCKAAAPEDFCDNCGSPQVVKADPIRTCKGCGNDMKDTAKFCTKCGMAKHHPPQQPIQEKTMTDQEKTALEARVAKAEKIAELNDIQKAHYGRLSASEQEAFLAKSAAERAEETKPVFTSDDGTVYTKADDVRMVEIAKRADADRKRYEAEIAKGRESIYKSRAAEELKFFKGDESVRVAILKAIDGIADEAVRKSALEAVQAHNAELGKSFVSTGLGNAGKPGDATGPQEKLDAAVQKFATDNNVSFEKAYDAVLGTAEGARLYKSIEDAKRN